MPSWIHNDCDFRDLSCVMGKDELDFDDGFSTFIMVAVIMVVVFILVTSCMCFCAYLRNRDRRAIYSTPIVVTGQTYQPPNTQGPYQVSVQTSAVSSQHQPVAPPMPMPQPVIQTPYPMVPQPLPIAPSTTAPYPVNNTQQTMDDQNPPSYNQATGQTYFNKQPAFNPSFSS